MPDSSFRTVRRQFLCCAPLKTIEWSNFIKSLNWTKQEEFVKATIYYEPNILHPTKISYQRAFMKVLIELLERQGSEIHDIVFDTYGRLVALPDLKCNYKHYQIESGEIITLKENNAIISEGTTGLCTWQAALVLAEWCLANRGLIKNRTILELGSGIGLTGISTAFFCRPKTIYMSDHHHAVVKNLSDNIHLNAYLESNSVDVQTTERIFDDDELFKTLQFSDDSTTAVHVLNLAWQTIDESVVKTLAADLILAADLVYDGTLFKPLIMAIKQLLKRPGSKMIMACTERNPVTLQEFLIFLEGESLRYSKLPLPQQRNYIWSCEITPVRLFEISLV